MSIRSVHSVRAVVPSVRYSTSHEEPAAAISLSVRLRQRGRHQDGGELGVPIVDEELERGEPVGEIHDQVRACWAVQSPSGCAVIPRMCTRRVAISMTNRTYSRLRKIMSTVKKSRAGGPWAWVRRNSRQDVSMPRGASENRRTVAALMDGQADSTRRGPGGRSEQQRPGPHGAGVADQTQRDRKWC